MNTKIVQALRIPAYCYENHIFLNFNEWCVLYSSKTAVPLKRFGLSEKLWNWYLKQWKLYAESQFLKDCKPYLKEGISDVEHYLELLDLYAEEIRDKYPSSIIKNIENEYIKAQRQIK